MKSLWKCLIRSMLTIGIGASLSGAASAQDAEQAGIVRITKPRTSDVSSNNISHGQVMPVSAMMADGSCVPPTPTPSAAMSPMTANPSVQGMPVQPELACDQSGACDESCQRGRRKYYRQDWRYSDWQSENRWGRGLHMQTQAHSLAFDDAFRRSAGLGGPSVYYHDPSGHAMLDYFKCKFGYFIPTGGGGKGIPWVGHYARVYPVNPGYSDQRDGQTWAAQGYGIPMAVPLAPVVGHTYDYGWGVPSSRLTPVSNPAY